MKKLVYIFSLLLLACACNLEDFEPQTSRDADKVEMSFSVSVPESQSMTRAMADDPKLTSMHAIVFDHNGFLVEYVQAELVSETNSTDYEYKIALTKSDKARRIHFVGNCPKTPKFGMESEVMADLQTISPEDAYWYRVEVPYIHAKSTEGNSPFDPDSETISAFGKIVLTRNFAKVVVEAAEGSGFTLLSYAVFGTPKVGTVAPYNRKTHKFQDYVGLSFKDLQDAQYDAFVPIDASPNFDLNEDDLTPYPKYVYERETSLSNPAYVIVKGIYEGETCYYKIDLRDQQGNYFPILRNFRYTIKINSVTRKGTSSFEKAMTGPGSGDVSSAVEYESYTNISDGSARLFVEYTSKVLVSEKDVYLKVKFIGLGETVKLTEPPTITINEDSGISGDAIKYAVLDGENTDEKGWYTFKITPESMGDKKTPKTQSVTVTGKYSINGEEKTISRKVHYILMHPRKMTVVCDPDAIPVIKESAFDVLVTIDNALPQAMFPLSFNIEAENLTITPDNDSMPVESGESTIPGSTKKSSFWFVKTLSYEEYLASELNTDTGERTFRCNFKSNTENSATKIFVSNEYFIQDNCLLGNYSPSFFRELEFDSEPYSVAEGIPVKFSFETEINEEMPAGKFITVTLTGLEPADPETTNLHFLGKDAEGNGLFNLALMEENAKYDLDLKTTESSYKNLNVKLEAYHFIPESLEGKRVKLNYVDPKFPDYINRGIGEDAKFTFSYDERVSSEDVTMILTNIIPDKEDDRFKEISNGVYIFKPKSDSGLKQEIVFKTTSISGAVKVEMSGSSYYSVTTSRSKRYYSSFTVNLTLNNAKPNGYNSYGSISVSSTIGT